MLRNGCMKFVVFVVVFWPILGDGGFLTKLAVSDQCFSLSGMSTIGTEITREQDPDLTSSDCCLRCFNGRDFPGCLAADFRPGYCIYYKKSHGQREDPQSTMLSQHPISSTTRRPTTRRRRTTSTTSTTSTTRQPTTSTTSTGTSPTKDDYKKITCPFLSTLIHEDALPVREWYTKGELTDLVLNAGLPMEETSGHIHAQFRMLRTLKIDIFNMEGLPDEHQTSSGINDCYSNYDNYQSCPASEEPGILQGVRVCPTPDKDCGVPNVDKFGAFWSHFDADGDDWLTIDELNLGAGSFAPSAIDRNEDPNVEGLLQDAFKFLIQVFTGFDRISKNDMMAINLRREYPSTYAFGEGCSDETEYIAPFFQTDSGHSYQFGIKSYYDDVHSGRWLAIDADNQVITSTVKHLWTVFVYDTHHGPRVALRSSHTGRWLNADPDGNLGAAASHSYWEEWAALPYTADFSRLSLQSVFGGNLSVNYETGRPGIVQHQTSRDEEFSLVYCKLSEFNDALLVA